MYCKYCGHELNSENICTNPECPSKQHKDDMNLGNDKRIEFRDSNGISTSEMIAFVGDKKADYYLDKWTEYQNNENFISWNWPAFLCGFYWFWYRKMYSVMTIILAISIAGTIFLPEWIDSILVLGVSIGCGLFGNQLYMKHATKRIISIKSLLSRGFDYNMIMRKLYTNGGTTIVPIIVFIGLIILIIFLLILGVVIGMSTVGYDPSAILY